MTFRPLALRWFTGIVLAAALAACAPAAQPAPTAAPTAAQTVAPVALATPINITVDVDRQADGTTLVHDVGNSYEFTLGQEWMAVPVSRERIEALAQVSPALDAEFLRLAEKLYANQKDAFRLIGINTDDKFSGAETPTLVLVTAIPDRISAAMPLTQLARMIQDTVFTKARESEMQRDVLHNAHGLSLVAVEGPYEYYSTQGETLQTRSRVLGFQANSRVILIQFITPVQFGSDVLPGVDEVIGSLQRIKP